jgi:hypothetical protein
MVLYALRCVSNVLASPRTTRKGSWEANLGFLRGVLSQNPAFIRVSLSDVRVIMENMRVFVVELLCEVVTGRIPVLDCLLLGACGRMWLCLVLSALNDITI